MGTREEGDSTVPSMNPQEFLLYNDTTGDYWIIEDYWGILKINTYDAFQHQQIDSVLTSVN